MQEEIEIPTTFGTIAAKKWTLCGEDRNNVAGDKYLAIHGWQDNCGSFDLLLPLLNHNMQVVAIDLPGHGLSSHFPLGCSYTDLSYAMDVKRVADYLEWTKFSIIGHSMGGYVGIFFASLFPEMVERVISLDIVKPLTFSPGDLAKQTAKSIVDFLEMDSKVSKVSPVPIYSHEEAVDRLIQGHSKLGVLTKEAATILLKRGCRVAEGHQDKVVFTRDPRLRALFFTRLDTTTVKGYLSKLKCELLIVKAKNGLDLDEKKVTQEFVDLYKEASTRFAYVEAEGDHHFHLMDAQNVADAINQFLDKSHPHNGQNGSAETPATNGVSNGHQNHEVEVSERKKPIVKVEDITSK